MRWVPKAQGLKFPAVRVESDCSWFAVVDREGDCVSLCWYREDAAVVLQENSSRNYTIVEVELIP